MIEKTNKEHLQNFMDFVQKEGTSEFATQLRDYIYQFQAKSKKQVVVRKCQYIMKRGLNTGKPCMATIKEVDDILLCTKHRKNASEISQPVVVLSEEEDAVIDDIISSPEEEEWFDDEFLEEPEL
jgi:predicted metal-dependent HD superfamily phosphohydrolase